MPIAERSFPLLFSTKTRAYTSSRVAPGAIWRAVALDYWENSEKGSPLMWQSQQEKHPCAKGGDNHANDFGGSDVFEDLLHRPDLITDS
jgi:hypothetical protein